MTNNNDQETQQILDALGINPSVSHRAKIAAEQADRRRQVLYLTEMTNEQLDCFLLLTGAEWVRQFFHPFYPCEDILGSELFEDWWGFCWSAMDKAIVKELYNMPKGSELAQYRRMHQNIFDKNSDAHKLLVADFKSTFKNFKK